MPDGPARTRPGSPCPDAEIEGGFLLDRLGGRFTLLAIGVDAAPVDAGEIPLDLITLPWAGALADRYGRGLYLIRPDQHVAARWPAFNETAIHAALARATGNTP